MAILGLTHDANGAPVTRLPVTIKVAIGEKIEKDNGNSHPARLDHFVFKRRTQSGQEVSWQPAQDITGLFEAAPRAIGIIFTSNDIEDVLRTEPALYSALGVKCRGKLVQIQDAGGLRFEMQAIRRTKRAPKGEVWPGKYRYLNGEQKGQPIPPCGESCPEFRERKCKYSGDLYFRLEKYPVYGAICRIHTGSPRSIKYLSSGLTQIYEQNGRRLAGVCAVLRVTPELTWYRDKDGVPHPTIIHVLSVEAPGTVSITSDLVEPNRGASSNGSVVVAEQCVAVEAESDRVKEITPEFYPHSEAGDDGADYFVPADDPGDEEAVSNKGQEERIRILANKLGYTNAKVEMLLGESGPNLDALEQKLKDALDSGTTTTASEASNRMIDTEANEPKLNTLASAGLSQSATQAQATAKQGSLYH